MKKRDMNMWDKLERLEKLRARVKAISEEIAAIEADVKAEIRTYMNRHLQKGA